MPGSLDDAFVICWEEGCGVTISLSVDVQCAGRLPFEESVISHRLYRHYQKCHPEYRALELINSVVVR